MANVRAALKTTLAALTPNAETVVAFDWGSDELTLDRLEQSVFEGVGLFIGSESSESEYHSHAYRIETTEYTVFVAEKRMDNRALLSLYISEMMSDLALSTLGLGAVLSVEVTGRQEIEQPLPAIVWQPVTIEVKHLVDVNLSSSQVTLGVDPPTVTIVHEGVEAWAATLIGLLQFDVTMTSGTGTPTRLYLIVEIGGESEVFSYTQAVDENTTSVSITFGELLHDYTEYNGLSSVFRAVVVDDLGACGVDNHTQLLGS